jgi:hypothetical protein
VGLFSKGMSRRKLLREGVQADAEIIDIRYTNTNDTHGPLHAVKLIVRGPDGRPFEVDSKINASLSSPPVPGQVIPIRYDPQRPARLVFDEDVASARHDQDVEARRRAAMGEGP